MARTHPGPAPSPAQRALVRGLLDDASLFPPASLRMPAAVTAHARHGAAWYADLAGPFVCPETRLAELGAVLTVMNTPWIDIALVVTGGADAVAAGADAVAADPRLRLRAVEVRATEAAEAAVGRVADSLDAVPLAGAAGYIEVPLDAAPDGRTVAELFRLIDGRGYRPKLRTGGVTPAAFPSEPLLAGCLAAAAEHRVRFKCTAGLHHAVRHTDTLEQHGFLNVLLAVRDALAGEPVTAIAGTLAERDRTVIADEVRALAPSAIEEIRFSFISFGTCSTDEPVADLVGLGLLSPS